MNLIQSGRTFRRRMCSWLVILAAVGIGGLTLSAETVSIPNTDNLSPVRLLDAGFPELGRSNSLLVRALEFNPVLSTGLPIPQFRLPLARVANGARIATQVDSEGLPFPRTHFDPIRLSQASALQVAATKPAVVPARENIANPAQTSAATTLNRPTESVAAKPVAPVPLTRAPVRAAAPIAQTVVRPPVPIQRTTTPATVEVSKQRTPPLTSTTIAQMALPPSAPSTVAAVPKSAHSSLEIASAHSLPEYHLVQLPAQTPPPMPAQSLATTSQDFNGTQGQTLSIKLAGRGWIYTGTGKTPAGVAYVEKTVLSDNEQFRFRLDVAGRHVLQFQRQDVASGLLDRQEAAITVQSRITGLATGQMQAVSVVQPTSSQYQPEYQIPQDPSVRVSMNANPQTVLLPVSAPIPTDAQGLFALAVKNEQDRQSGSALALYEKLVKDWPSWERSDEVLFRTARLLESASDGKDVKRAYDLYMKIQTDYPYSSWVDQSKERGRYISRTFFHP